MWNWFFGGFVTLGDLGPATCKKYVAAVQRLCEDDGPGSGSMLGISLSLSLFLSCCLSLSLSVSLGFCVLLSFGSYKGYKLHRFASHFIKLCVFVRVFVVFFQLFKKSHRS